MRVGGCSAAVAATARSATGKTAVAFGPDNPLRKLPDVGKGKEAEGSIRLQRRILPQAQQSAGHGLLHCPCDQQGRAKDKGDATQDHGLTR